MIETSEVSMELRHLRYFVVVAEYEHFGRAAKKLGVSQSPLSRQIAQLEDELGAKLFAPAGRGVRLTEAGTVFLAGARETLATAERAVADAREAAAGRVGTLTLAFENGTAFGEALAGIVGQFHAKFPRVRVDLIPMSSGDQWLALKNRTVDIGVGYYAPSDPELESRVLSRAGIGVMLPTSHRLAKKRRVRVNDLKNERFIWAPRWENPQLDNHLVSELVRHGMSAPVVHERDGEAVLTLVSAGFGVSLQPTSLGFAIPGTNVVLREVIDIAVDINKYLMWRGDESNEPFVRAFLDLATYRRSASPS